MKAIGLLLTGMALSLAAETAAQGADSNVRYLREGVAVIMRHGTAPVPVAVGENALDGPHPFTCHPASGCAVVMSSSVKNTDTIGVYACSYVDGNLTGAPGCWYGAGSSNNTAIAVTRQQIFVPQGRHTIETRLHSDNTAGQVDGWAVDYTIYPRPNH